MKVNEFKKLEEGFFSDLAGVGGSARDDNKDKISEKSKSLFIRDFIKDFDADLKEYINNGLIKPRVRMSATSSTVTEDYAYLNDLVEGYLMEQKSMSPSEFVEYWFGAYMKGVDWDQNINKVRDIAKEIEQSYKTDKGMAGITKLANLAWELVDSSDAVPYGAQDVLPRNLGKTYNLNPEDRKVLANVIGSIDDNNFKKELIALLSKHNK